MMCCLRLPSAHSAAHIFNKTQMHAGRGSMLGQAHPWLQSSCLCRLSNMRQSALEINLRIISGRGREDAQERGQQLISD